MSLELRESISSFIDEELDADNCDVLIRRLSGNKEQKDIFGRYCLMRDAMKRNLPENLNHNLLERVQVALASEPVFLAPVEKKPIERDSPEADIVLLPQRERESKQSTFKPVFGFSIAASITIVAVLGFQMFTGNEDLAQNAAIAVNPAPLTQEIIISAKPVVPSPAATLVADEIPLLSASSDSDSATFAEQSVIDDGQWTRITRIGDIPLRNYVIFNGTENVLFDFQRNASPMVRSVNLDSLPAE